MILKRLGQGLLVLLVLETVTFFLIRLLPGHPFMGEKKLPEHVLQQLQTSYGLAPPPSGGWEAWIPGRCSAL